MTIDPINKKWLNGEIEKKVFKDRSHGVDYCLTIMKKVFTEREDQIRELAKSQPIEALVTDVDTRIKHEAKSTSPGEKE